MSQTASNAAHQGRSEPHDAVGDAGAVHELPGHDEERHRHEGERIHAREHALGDEVERDVAQDQQHREAG